MSRVDLGMSQGCLRYYGGWCDKIHGKVIDTNPDTFNYTKQEPVSFLSSRTLMIILAKFCRSVFVVRLFLGTFLCSCGRGRLVLPLPAVMPLY